MTSRTISYTRTLDPAAHNLAVASATTFSMISAQAFMITTVHVPRAFRGEKHGSGVLDDLCLRADMDGYELYVDPRSHDASRLTGQDLVEWFERRGFTMFGGILRRLPQRRGAPVETGQFDPLKRGKYGDPKNRELKPTALEEDDDNNGGFF